MSYVLKVEETWEKFQELKTTQSLFYQFASATPWGQGF